MHAAIATTHCRSVSGCDAIAKSDTDAMHETAYWQEMECEQVKFNDRSLSVESSNQHPLVTSDSSYENVAIVDASELHFDISNELLDRWSRDAAELPALHSGDTGSKLVKSVSHRTDQQIGHINSCELGLAASTLTPQEVISTAAMTTTTTTTGDHRVSVASRNEVVFVLAATQSTSVTSMNGKPLVSGSATPGVLGMEANTAFSFDVINGRLTSSDGSSATIVYCTSAADVQRMCNTSGTNNVPVVISTSPFRSDDVTSSIATSCFAHTLANGKSLQGASATAEATLTTSCAGGDDRKKNFFSSAVKPAPATVHRAISAPTSMAMMRNCANVINGVDGFVIKTEPGCGTISFDDANVNQPVNLVKYGDAVRSCGAYSGENAVDSTTTPRMTSPGKPESGTTVGVNSAVEGIVGVGTTSCGVSTSVNSGKIFSCPICSRDFASEKYLSMHVSLHQQQQQQQQILQQTGSIVGATTFELPVTPPSTAPVTLSMTSVAESEGDVHRLLQYGSVVFNSSYQQPFLPNGSTFYTSSSSSTPNLSAASTTAAVKQPPPPPIRRAKTGSGTKIGGGHWTCQICEKTFAQNSNYKNHIRTHSNERPFVCEICSIGFKERYHLKKHVLFKHTDELREECRVCGKRFKDSTAVRAHERTHSDLRPYACPRCEKTFKTSECLWHHENRSKTCGKSLGDLPATCNAFRTPLVTGNENGGTGGSRGQARRRRPPSVVGAKRKQHTTMIQPPIELTIKTESCLQAPPALIRFPVDDEQMVYTEIVVSDDQRAQHCQQRDRMQQHDAEQLRHVDVVAASFGTAVTDDSRTLSTSFVQNFATSVSKINDPLNLIASSGNISSVAVATGHPVFDLSVGTATSSINRSLMSVTQSHATPSPSSTPAQFLSAPGFIGNNGWSIIHDNQASRQPQSLPQLPQPLQSEVRRNLAGQQQHHQHHHHTHPHHQLQQQTHLLQHHQRQQQQLHHNQAVEVKIETDAMMDLLDYNLTALNHSTDDSSLFDDFAMDIAGVGDAGDESTDYYDKFVDNDGTGDSLGEERERKADDGLLARINGFDQQQLLQHQEVDQRNDAEQLMNQLVSDAVCSQSLLATSLLQQKVPGLKLPSESVSGSKTATVSGSLNATDPSTTPLSPPRPYRCDQCSVGFKLKVHLKKHNLYKHSDEYPCACGVCGKRFKDSSAVRLHERIHSTARPFQCQRCGKSFKTRENLWGHRHRGPCDRGLVDSALNGGGESTVAGTETDGHREANASVDELGNEKLFRETATPLSSPKGHETVGSRSAHPADIFRPNSQHIVGGADQVVVQIPDGTTFLAKLSTAITSAGYSCNTAPSTVAVSRFGVSSHVLAPNSDFVSVGWVPSTLHQPQSLSTVEVPSHVREVTTIGSGRRLLGRQSMPSSNCGIGAVVAAAARTMMMQIPAVQGQTWLRSTATPPGMPPLATLPTAVVAPIKREQPEIVSSLSSSVFCPTSSPVSDAPGHFVQVVQSSSTALSGAAEKYSLPPFSTLISSASHRQPNETPTSPVSTMSGTGVCSMLPTSSFSSPNFDGSMTTNVQKDHDQSCDGNDSMVRLPGIDQLFLKTSGVVDKPMVRKNEPHTLMNGYHFINLTGASKIVGSFQQAQLTESKLLEMVDNANLGVWKRRQQGSNVAATSPADQFQSYGIKLAGHNDNNVRVTCLPPPPPYPGLGPSTQGVSSHMCEFGESTATGNSRSQQLLSIVGKR